LASGLEVSAPVLLKKVAEWRNPFENQLEMMENTWKTMENLWEIVEIG